MTGESTPPTGWLEIWNSKSVNNADWNGFESCFPDRAAYDAYAAAMAAFICITLSIGPGDMVVDLGCGTGIVASEVADRAERVLGLDYSEVALEVARDLRQRPNISYEFADLNEIDPERLRPANKAYAVGSVYYLESKDNVYRIVDALVAGGAEVLLVDLPDANIADSRKRNYDTSQYRHLAFTESDFTERYSQVSFHRGIYPKYVNDAVRFSAHVMPPQHSI